MADLWNVGKIPFVGHEKGLSEGLGFHYYQPDRVVEIGRAHV